MQSEEQRLIDGLFSRLKEAEAKSAPRDASAEALIAQHVNAQPIAPYYMAQTILIQEAAIKQLNSRVQDLESQVATLQSAKQSSGGFLSGLFGGGQSQPRVADPVPGASQYAPQYGNRQQNSAPPAGGQNYAAPRGSGFMAGALQTAAGVAGGVVLGNMLTNMFSGSHPQEIVNIIDEPPAADPTPADADITPAADVTPADNGQFLTPDDGAGWSDDNDNDYGNDDDSWI